MITYQEERFKDAWDTGFKELAQSHWIETMQPITSDDFNPDTKRYEDYNECRFYRLYTARENGVLIGDLGMYITQSMHTNKLVAQEDSWYIIPSKRVGRVALNFVRFVESELLKDGITSIRVSTPYTAKSNRLLQYMGYKVIGSNYYKEIYNV